MVSFTFQGCFTPEKKPTEKRGCQKKGNVALWALWKNVAGWRRRENIWDVRSKTVGIMATFPVKYNDLRQRHSRYFRNPFKLTLRKVIQTYDFWQRFRDVTRRHPPKVGESLLFWGKPVAEMCKSPVTRFGESFLITRSHEMGRLRLACIDFTFLGPWDSNSAVYFAQHF